MPAAIGAENFSASAVAVGFAAYSAGYFIVEAGPAAARVKFVAGAVKWRFALTANIGAGGFVIPVFARKRVFCAFLQNDISLFGRQRIAFVRHGCCCLAVIS